MPDATDKSALEQIAAILQSHQVEFIVIIGGQAELLHGSPRVTYDVDVCYHRSVDNLKRLEAALNQLANLYVRAVQKKKAPTNREPFCAM